MSILRKMFRDNLGIKVAAIVLSLLVFFYARTQKEGELVFKVAVELKGIPDSLTWTGDAPGQVSVALSGKLRSLIKLRLGSLRIPVDLSQTEPGRFQRTLSAADVPLPEGSNVIVSHFAGPERIDIVIERKLSKPVRVAPLVAGSPAEGFAVSAPPVAVPETVSVNGPASLVAPIDSLLTEPVDISQRRQPFSTKVKLSLQNKALRCDTQVVEVFVEILPESLGAVEETPSPGSRH